MTYQNGVKYDKELHENLRADCLIELDLVAHRNNVNTLLLKTSEVVRTKEHRAKRLL